MLDVLVVDDNKVIREMIEDFLLANRYNAMGAEHGRAALDLLEQGHRPKMILLDLRMPVMDGWELLERLQHSGFDAIPVVVRTSLVDQPELYADLPHRFGCEVLEKGVGLSPMMEKVAQYCGPA